MQILQKRNLCKVNQGRLVTYKPRYDRVLVILQLVSSKKLTELLLCKFQNLDFVLGLFTWSGGPRPGGVGFFCFHALDITKQKKPTPLDRGSPLHVNRVRGNTSGVDHK